MATIKRDFKLKHDALLTFTKWILCLNVTRRSVELQNNTVLSETFIASVYSGDRVGSGGRRGQTAPRHSELVGL